MGQAACLGRAFALQEIKMIIAALVQRFDITFGPNYDEAVWLNSLREYAVLAKGDLYVNIKAHSI